MNASPNFFEILTHARNGNRIAGVKQKVLAYIVRQRADEPELLVFEHTDPADRDAGIQVVKGTADPGESVEEAMRRELREESGMSHLDNLSMIGQLQQDWEDGSEEWHIFAARVNSDLPDVWEHTVTGAGDDGGKIFRYFWLPLNSHPRLAGRLDAGFKFLDAYLAANGQEPAR